MEKVYVKFPDMHVTVEDIIAEGDKVMVRNVWRATDPSTGKKLESKASYSGDWLTVRLPSVGPQSRPDGMNRVPTFSPVIKRKNCMKLIMFGSHRNDWQPNSE